MAIGVSPVNKMLLCRVQFPTGQLNRETKHLALFVDCYAAQILGLMMSEPGTEEEKKIKCHLCAAHSKINSKTKYI